MVRRVRCFGSCNAHPTSCRLVQDDLDKLFRLYLVSASAFPESVMIRLAVQLATVRGIDYTPTAASFACSTGLFLRSTDSSRLLSTLAADVCPYEPAMVGTEANAVFAKII